MWYLEEIVGELKMEEFLRFYYKKFAFKSIDSDDFKETFLEYFKDDEVVDDIDWKTWLYEPGLPIWKPVFDDSLARVCWELAEQWQTWNPSTPVPAQFEDTFNNFLPKQKQEFLGTLISGSPLEIAKIEKMSQLYKLDKSTNVEHLLLWIRLGLKARWEPSVAEALELVNSVGRWNIVRPLYRDLYDWEEKRQLAIDNFLAHGNSLMYGVAENVEKILFNIDD